MSGCKDRCTTPHCVTVVICRCPNHCEQLLDSAVLSSTSATERVRLWERHARQPVQHHAVKLQFMKRCARVKRDDKFRRRRAGGAGAGTKVPGWVVAQYRTPPPLLSGLSSTVPAHQQQTGEPGEQEREWLAGLVSLQADILQQKLDKVVQTRNREFQEKRQMKEHERESRAAEQLKERSDEMVLKEEEMEMKDESNYLKEELDDLKVERREVNGQTNGVEEDAEEQEELKDDDEPAQHLLHSPASTLSTCSLSPRHAAQLRPSLAGQLSEYLAQQGGTSVAELDRVVVDYLAHRQLASLIPAPAPAPARARASLTPLHSRRQPAYMEYRTLSLGLGASVGVDLARFGHCQYLSTRHACIHYDGLGDQYELINYSQYGTRVDEVLYGLGGKTGGGAQLGPGCRCHGPSGPGCEGSALLRHGSLLQFGCLQFVFAVAGTEDEAEL